MFAAPHVLTVGLLCLASGYMTLLLTRGTHGIAVLWVSNAILLAALLARPTARLPLLLSGALGIGAANLLAGNAPGTSLGLMSANLVDVLVGFALMRRLNVGRFEFGSLPYLARFLPICGLVGPAVSAILGAAVASSAFGGPYLATWLSWFARCSLGTIIVAPLLVAIWQHGSTSAPRSQGASRFAAPGAIAGIGLINLFVFDSSGSPVLFASFAGVAIATVLLGQRMASIGIAITAIAGISSVLSGNGPLMLIPDMDERVLMLQTYLAVLALTCLLIAAVLQQRQRLTERLAVAEAQHRLLSEGSDDAMLHVDLHGTVLHASRAVSDLTGLAPEKMVGHPGVDFVHPDDCAAVIRTHVQVVKNGGAATVRYRYTHQLDGRERHLEARTRAVLTGEQVTGVITAVRDVTLLVAQEARLEQAAATDPLTGLANRRHFMAMLEQCLASAESGPVAVAMLDIDHFKRFNDRHGHAAGDAVLCAVAHAANAALRKGDLIGRLGGEEFGLLLPGTGRDDAMMIAERVRSAVAAQIINFAGEALRVTISVGAAVSGPETSTPAALLAAADAFLYSAKSEGRNCVRLAA